MMFDLSKFQHIKLLEYLIEQSHQHLEKDEILQKLFDAGFEKEIKDLWEIGMIKSQKTDIFHIKKQITLLLTGVQIKQLKYDLNEAKIKITKSDASKEDYDQYLMLQNELNTLIAETSDL